MKICKCLPLVCVLLAVLLILPLHAFAEDVEYAVSGDLDREKPSKEQILEAWNQVSVYENYYIQEPSVVYPYAAGALTEDYLQSGLSYLNYIRYVAGLPSVQLSDSMTENAQYGAVLLAANDTLTHYPSQPADMSDAFFEQGYAATSSSNISARYGYGNIDYLHSSLSGCLADSGSNNLAVVGHRRWLLNPDLLNVGFGFAESTAGTAYVTTKVFDWSAEPVNYEFISWPASGYVPTNLFHGEDPWSVTLNPSLYRKPQLEDITVTLTRMSDGTQWTFDADTGGPTTCEYPYMTVDYQGCGVPNCLIFSPGSEAIGAYDGVYTVNIQGLYTVDGEQTQLNYRVEFFDIGPCEHVYAEKKVASTCVSWGYTIYSCKICGEMSYGDYVQPGEHGWNEGMVTQEPTEYTTGVRTYTCIHCGETKTESIPATHSHSYEPSVVPPTCSTSGYTVYTCSCGDSYRYNYVDPLPHTPGEPVETEREDPSCLMDGSHILATYCTECGSCISEVWEKIPAPGHTYQDTSRAPTCTEYGMVEQTCTVCGDVQTLQLLEPLGHEQGTLKTEVIQEHSCASQGVVRVTASCKVCGQALVDRIETYEPYPHVPVVSDEYVSKEPYCEVPGERVVQLSCEKCGTNLGIEIYEIPALEHDYRHYVAEPTCHLLGKTTHTCQRCLYSYEDSFVDMTDHSWGDWTVEKEPTYLENGEKSRACSECLEEERQTVSNNPFEDVGEGNRFKNAILWAYYNNITAGKTATTFEPETDVTRGQFVTFLWRAAGEPEPASYENPFEDVPDGKYYTEAVLWAYYEGITAGTTETTFEPSKICSRGQVVMFLYRYAGEPEIGEVENPFTDVSSGNRYYKAIMWAYSNNITSGKTPTTFQIGSSCYRSHVVTFLYRYLV